MTSSRRLSGARARRNQGSTAGVHKLLRQAVIGGVLKPGDCLVEHQVARRFGVSRAPAREALKRLEGEGLLHAVPRRGYTVAPITVRQVQELYDLRLLLEREAAARAASRPKGPGAIQELERLVGTPYVLGDPGSYRAFLEKNTAFHQAVARLAGNERIAGLIRTLLEELQRLFHLGLNIRDRAEQLVREHRDLVDAISGHDPAAAARIVVLQIENSRQMVLEGILSGALQVGVR